MMEFVALNERFLAAVNQGDDKAVGELLAKEPRLIQTHAKILHRVAQRGHDKVAARLLAAKPTLIDETDGDRWTPLHWAIQEGQERVVALLLATKPASIEATTGQGYTALQIAAYTGHERIVALLLAQSPSIIDGVSLDGRNALHCAMKCHCYEAVADKLLAVKPGLIHGVDMEGNSPLHLLAQKPSCRLEFFERMFKLHPQNVRVTNANEQTPFHVAIQVDNEPVIELLRGALTVDEIVRAFTLYCASKSQIKRFKVTLALQCEPMSVTLTRDVMRIVYEYILIDL